MKNIVWMALALTVLTVACKKNSPVEELGKSNGQYRPELRVSLSTRSLKVGDTVNVTTTTWERSDQIAKVEYLHKLYENFGIYLELQTTKLETWSATAPKMVVTDTIANGAWKTFPENGKNLNSYYVTASNAYVLAAVYKQFKATGGKYKMEGADLLNALPNEAYNNLLSQLAYVITVAEFSTFFPAAPEECFTKTGATRTGISDVGKAYLRDNLSRALFVQKGFKTFKKQGLLHASVTSKVTSVSGAVAQVTNEFEATYQ